MCEFMLCLLDLRVVGDGHRPILDSGMNWHVILFSFLIFFHAWTCAHQLFVEMPQWPLHVILWSLRLMIWLMCWSSSFEEAELHGWDSLKTKLWFCLYSMLSLLVFICYLILIELYFMLSISVICYLILIELDFMLSLSVFGYLMVMNFTASSVLSYYCVVIVCLNQEN